MKVVAISKKPNQDAVKMLKETIAMVESGEIVSVAVCWVTKNDAICGDVSGGGNGTLQWASIEHSARSFYQNVVLGGD